MKFTINFVQKITNTSLLPKIKKNKGEYSKMNIGVLEYFLSLYMDLLGHLFVTEDDFGVLEYLLWSANIITHSYNDIRKFQF